MAQVELKNISKVYDGNAAPAVCDLNLDIRDGELMVLVGPSGCGKSTTLRMIAGLEQPSTGEICIGGRAVTHVQPKDRDIAMVFQNYALYPHMSVRENLAFGLKLRKVPKPEIRLRVEEAAQLLEIGEYLDRKPKALSGGQRQRVALGRAIVRKPNVFLFDEPLSNLDAKLRVQMRTEIKRLHQRLGTTMIYVTHDQVEAMTMGDRIAVLGAGIMHQIDTPLRLYQFPADLFVAGFIGSPAMNTLAVTLVDQVLREVDGNVTFRIPPPDAVRLHALEGKNVVFAIRPEHVLLKPEDCVHPAAVTLRHEVSEQLGNETCMYLTTGRSPVVARTNPVNPPAPGENIAVYFDLSKAHYFHFDSHRRIG